LSAGKIRVQYSGLVSFLLHVLSAVTGGCFILLITRSLSVDDFGTWGVLYSLLAYVIFFAPAVNYWQTREIARGEKSGSTSLLSVIFLSIIGFIVYYTALMSFGFSEVTDHDLLLFGIMMIPCLLLESVLSCILLGSRPHYVAVGWLVKDMIKIPFGFLFVMNFEWGLMGAVMAVVISHILSLSYLIYLSRDYIRVRVRIGYLRKWLKLSWLPLFGSAPRTLHLSDVALFTYLLSSVSWTGYFVVVNMIAMGMTYVDRLTYGIYPMILGTRNKSQFRIILHLLIYFSLLLLLLSVTFAEPALTIMNPVYSSAVYAVMILSLAYLFRSLSNLFFVSLEALEEVDKKEFTLKQCVQSRLFFFPMISTIKSVTYVILFVIMISWMASVGVDDISYIEYWTALILLSEVSLFLFMFRIAKREFDFCAKSDLITISKYVFTTIILSSLFYFVYDLYPVHNNDLFTFVFVLLFHVLVVSLSYLYVTFMIDTGTRT